MGKKRESVCDLNVVAAQIVETATRGPAKKPPKAKSPQKNPAAVALGRLGGLKRGKARAKKLSPRMRADIARKAARARWKS